MSAQGYPFANPLADTEAAAPRDRARRAMRRSGALLFGVGALVTLVSVIVDNPGHNDADGLLVDTLVLAAATLVLLVGRRLPDWLFVLLPALGTLVISANLYFEPRTGGAIFYLWPIIWSAYFLARREMLLHLGFLAVAYGVVAFALTSTAEPATEWLNTVGAVATAAVLVSLLKDRLVQVVGRLQHRASVDPLTGVLNRGSLEEALTRELSRTQRTGTPLTLLVADLDHFKQVNDEHGHAAGDDALRQFCRTIEREKRGHDLLGRLGGEEFAIVLLDTDAEGGRQFAERVRGTLARVAQGPSFTASIGVAERTAALTATSQLMHAADTALYAAKESGRDRVLVAGPSVPRVAVA